MGRKPIAVTVLLSLAILLIFAYAVTGAVYPERGDDKASDGSLQIDCSHKALGYFMACVSGSSGKYKLRVTSGEMVFTYDIDGDGDYEVYPLQMGSGEYKIQLYKNIEGNKYAEAGLLTLKVTLDDEQAAFLCPNQYVDYSADSEVVSQAERLCGDLDSEEDKFNAVREYVVKNFTYDFVTAVTVKKSTLPDISRCLKKHMGICQDLAAMTCAMLRSQGVKAQLVIGYAGDNYHAWVNAIIDGKNRFFDPTAEIGGIAKDLTYTVERYY